MGANVNLNCKHRLVRGTLPQLKRYCKSKNIACKFIQEDKRGYYLKARDRGKLHKR